MAGLSSDLTVEEQAILESVERGEWKSIPNLAQAIERYRQYAQQQINALEAVSINLSADDLQVFRQMAERLDTPVSLLIASVLHQYVASQPLP
ncbi:MAG: hypothetical protein WBB01_01830 [Phormidesmis sp.]